MNWPKFLWCAGLDIRSCPGQRLKAQYNEMRRINCKNCDKFFHCQGNYDAVHRCGKKAENLRLAKKISDCREAAQDPGSADSLEDQKANTLGQNGGNCTTEYLCKANCKYNFRSKTCLKSNCP
ncbi:unnamed protein product [Rotaria socialis]|uniref:Uncharacterized protein n=3 Tax=Rotaria socialis TaxID=392032 RepID=A0A818IHE1_9BILA|nr:unnamed protein product [Rotaria socialis]CAF3415749.1 unnamed protein product [Rotaria socialis]CAF3524563.1 unnamed protein product [Rotaria socialis]CAF4378127.1 unnamed protein product [Rotaria socialis]CAF4495044.1 unnamed protein product [Rotaria socialis]